MKKNLSKGEIRIIKLRKVWEKYITDAYTNSVIETGHSWPEKTYLVVGRGTELAEIFEDCTSVYGRFCAMDIIMMGSPGVSWDFFIACEWSSYLDKLQKSFYEYIQMNDVKKIEDAFDE